MINNFQNGNRYLSNFWYTPVVNLYDNDGVTYRSVEHAYQAAKSADWSDRIEIANIQSPYEVKKAGKSLVLRSNWESIKYAIMLSLVRNKFDNNPILRENLINTYPEELIEGNHWHDNIWGICYCDLCSERRSYDLIIAYNMLGKILMHVRFEHRIKKGII